jgi:hypothetical protein
MSLIKVKRGMRNNVPASNSAGELVFAMDTKELLIGNGPSLPNTLLVKKNVFDATVAPINTNDGLQGYTVGSIWVDITHKKCYTCIDTTTGNAVWSESTLARGNLAETTSSVLTITGGTSAILGSGVTVQVKQSSGSQAGYLSSTDWTTFNNKQSALTIGSVTESTSSVLTIVGGTGAIIGSGVTVQVKQASASQSGYLSSTDWATFNSKEPAITKGNLIESTSSVLAITGGTGAVIGSGLTIQVKQATSAQAGYLTSTDWATFNAKQPALGFTPENIANRGIASGYATLDGSSKLVQNVDASKITSGTIDIARLPAGSLERLVKVANQTARFALTTATVQLGDSVQQLDTGIMYIVVDEANLGNAAGYTAYTAATASAVDWSGVLNKPTTYSGYGITDVTPSSHIGSGGTSHAVATTSVAGFESAADKTKLDGIFAGATKVESSATNGNIKVNGSEMVVFTGIKNNYAATTNPTVTNDSSQGYSIGSAWVNTTLDNYYVCTDVTVGAAVWLLTAAISAVPTPRSFVQGCRLVYLTASTFAINVGTINISGTTYEIASKINVGWGNVATGTTKAASTWYYVYLKNVSGVLTPYISIAVPDKDSFGNTLTTAYDTAAKYNSSWGRFVGSFKTDASQNLINFYVNGNVVQFVGAGYLYILTSGTATTKTAVNCRTYVPYTSQMFSMYIEDLSGSGAKFVGDSSSWTWQGTNMTGSVEVSIPVTNNSVYYQVSSATRNISLGVHAYLEEI